MYYKTLMSEQNFEKLHIEKVVVVVLTAICTLDQDLAGTSGDLLLQC